MQKSTYKQEVVFHLERLKTLLSALSPRYAPRLGNLLAAMPDHPLFHVSVFLNYIGMFSFTGFTEEQRQMLTPVHCVNTIMESSSGLLKRIFDSPLVDSCFWRTQDSTFLFLLSPAVMARELDDRYLLLKMNHLRDMLGKDRRYASCILEGSLDTSSFETLLSAALSNTCVPSKFVLELYELGSRVHPLRYSRFLCESPAVLKRVTDLEAELVRRSAIKARSLSSPANVRHLSARMETYTLCE